MDEHQQAAPEAPSTFSLSAPLASNILPENLLCELCGNLGVGVDVRCAHLIDEVEHRLACVLIQGYAVRFVDKTAKNLVNQDSRCPLYQSRKIRPFEMMTMSVRENAQGRKHTLAEAGRRQSNSGAITRLSWKSGQALPYADGDNLPKIFESFIP